MIVDFHAHVFPPEICRNREDYLGRDSTFEKLYRNPRARLATADELLSEMDAAGVDASVILNFAWKDPSLQRLTNDYVTEAAANSAGRLIPFCMVNPEDKQAAVEIERCAAAGARGLGELRPEDQGYMLNQSAATELLLWAAKEKGLLLLFHTSEPVGHDYPGKSGLPLTSLYEFIEAHPDVPVVAAHWGGGLPFYALMPRVRKVLGNLYVDTAATGLLYDPAVYHHVIELCGSERVLFGSDFPYCDQCQCKDDLGRAGLSEEDRRLIAGENAARLLGLADEG